MIWNLVYSYIFLNDFVHSEFNITSFFLNDLSLLML